MQKNIPGQLVLKKYFHLVLDLLMTMLNLPSRWYQIGMSILISFALSLLLAWVSPGLNLVGFSIVVILGGLVIMMSWWSLRKESIPNWVGMLTIGAVILRLTMGVIWYLCLPIWGHGTEVETSGYVMSDAFQRDIAAWNLAKSDAPLISAFQEFRLVDQYGGLLFLSASVYRLVGGEIHQPLIMVVVTAFVSSVAVLFSWAFTKRLWNESISKYAVWIFALFPEAVLLGSSQMREAFMMTLMSMALFGLVHYWQNRNWQGLGWMLVALMLSLPLSTLFAVMLIAALLLMALILFREKITQNWLLWGVLGMLLVLGIGVVWIFGDRIYPDGASNPLELIQQWFVFAGRWEKKAVALSSGWFNKILNRSPEWMHIWLVLGYGSVQPFLPAALIATGNWFWRLIALWRSVGWTLMLMMLLYAPLLTIRHIKDSIIPFGVTILVWAGILLSAFRGGGDQWDNPRYRVIFIVLQSCLFAWVWVRQREMEDPWLRRILIGLGLVFVWFIPWYLRRYSGSFSWPIVDFFKTTALGFISAILYWLWDWARCENIGEESWDTGESGDAESS